MITLFSMMRGEIYLFTHYQITKKLENIISIKNNLKNKKNLNMILENQIIYVSDNIGYLYAYDIKKIKFYGLKITKLHLDQI